MAGLGGVPLALEPAGDVQQAAEIAGQHGRGPGRGDVGGLVGDHAHGDVGVFHAERAAEAAADLGVGHFGDGGTDGGEQAAGLVLDAQLAQAGERRGK